MTKEPNTKVLPETPVQAVVDERVEGDAPNEGEVIPKVDRRLDTWPHDDVRRVVRALTYTVSRGVGLVLVCHGCEQTLMFEGRDNGGASLMGCGCAVRRWL